MSIKYIAAVSALVLSTFVANAQASQLWTVTATGHIYRGHDITGVFGTAGQDLTGLLFTQSITTSFDPSQWDRHFATGFYELLEGSGPAFADTVTINGHSVTLNATSTLNGAQQVANDVSQGGAHGYVDAIVSIQAGYTAAGDILTANQYAQSSSAFVPTLDFSQKLSQDTSSSSVYALADFEISGHQNAGFGGTIDFLSVNAVPEPETYAMLLAGLGLLSVFVRRKT